MITYNINNVAKPDIDEAEVSAWVRQVAKKYDKIVGDVNYIFVDDETMLDINRRFIGHDYYTDHIGFDYSEGKALSGDIYISLDTVRTNAELYGATFDDELRRFIKINVFGSVRRIFANFFLPSQDNRTEIDFFVCDRVIIFTITGICQFSISFSF